MENQQVEFDQLIQDFQVKNVDLFAKYLVEIWRDLTRRSKDTLKGIEKLTFSHYYQLPGIINDRLYNNFDKNGKGYLQPNDFVGGMTVLFAGTFKDLTKFIFKFYDFDKDGYITKEDIRVVLSYIPLQKKYIKELMKYEQNDFRDRIDSQNELEEMLNKAFGSKEKMSESDFVNVIDNVSSDIFIYILMYLLEKRPFTEETIEVYAKKDKKETCHTPKAEPHKIASPSLKSKFMSPKLKKRTVEQVSKSVLSKYAANPSANSQTRTTTVPTSSFARAENINNNKINNPSNNSSITKGHAHKPKRHMKINFNEIDDVTKKTTTFGVTTDTNSVPILDEDKDFAESENQAPLVKHEGYMYKITESKAFKKVYFKLIGKDMYYFKSKSDGEHKGMHNLCGIYIKSEPQKIIEGKTYYSFSLQYPTKVRTYYLESEKDFKEWLSKLQLAIDYKSLLDQFQIKEKAGKGKFGLVKQAIHKATGRKVAIKIMAKKSMNNQDLELAKTEIDILKVCQHPNIIKLYDVYETVDYIYIVMEYCSGGDLFSYIEKRGYKLPEKRVAEIIHKLSMAIYYVHSYGIVHRDLKPENILMTSGDETADIRLLDFGLSKIIGPTDKCTEPYGTLSYVAPEVLNEKPYGMEVDLWSIGIITYLLLCGYLPFDDEVSEREIARQTIEDPVSYPDQIWKNLSKESKSFVDNLLKKNPKDRLTIKQVLEHPFLKKWINIPAERLSPQKNRNIFNLYCSDGKIEYK